MNNLLGRDVMQEAAGCGEKIVKMLLTPRREPDRILKPSVKNVSPWKGQRGLKRVLINRKLLL